MNRCFSVFLIFYSSFVLGQVSFDNQMWVDGNYSFFVNGKTSLIGDIGYRYECGELEWYQFIFRPGVKYTFSSNWKLNCGVGYFDRIFEGESFDRELRFYQGVETNIVATQKVLLKNYFRVEQRLFSGDVISSSFRTRNQITLSYKLVNKVKYQLLIPASVELFFDFFTITKAQYEGFRQRYFTGVEFKSKDNWKVQAVVNSQFNYVTDKPLFSQRESMYRLRFYVYLRKSSYYSKSIN